MSFEVTSTVVVLKTLTLLLGGSITYHAYRAYRRTGRLALGALGLGFGLVTVGSLLAGVIDQGLHAAPGTALLVESGFTFAGFGVILYSLHAS